MVFWHTGRAAADVLTTDDIAAMKYYLDRGGNLLLSTISGASDMSELDAAFMADYLGAEYTGQTFSPWFVGIDGNSVGDGTQYSYLSNAPDDQQNVIRVVNDGESAFNLIGKSSICGVTVHSSHNSVLLTIPIEFISDDITGWDTKVTLFSRIIDFFEQGVNSCCVIRGDINHDGDPVIDISDLVLLVDYMFNNGSEPACFVEADANGDGNEIIDITDLIYLINYMYRDGPSLPECP